MAIHGITEQILFKSLESAANAIIVTDRTGTILWVNSAFSRLTGYSREEAIGGSPRILKSGQHDEKFYAHMWSLLLKGAVWEGEITNRRKDGSLYIEQATITPVLSDDGRTTHFIAVKEDITRRKEAEESARIIKEANEEGLAELEAILGSLNDGLMIADLKGNLLRANPAARRICGFTSQEELTGPIEGYSELFEVTDSEGHLLSAEQRPLARAIRGDIFQNCEIRMRRKGWADWLVCSCSGTPVRVRNGKLIRAVVTLRDITDLKRAEAELKAKQRQLIRTEKLAAAGRLAATIAHEINNPLAASVNAVYLARTAHGLPEQAESALKLAEQELARASHIAKQTLGFYNESAEPRPVHLPQVLDQVVSLYSPKLRNKDILVRHKYKDLVISGVEGEIRQIVSNLVTNSIDALPTKGTLYVRVMGPVALRGNRRMVQITIADNGEGIAPENMRRIFEPFFTTKQSVGTGLGLWVTQELVAKHDGRIRIRTSLGKGTVVHVWLPIERRKQDRRTVT